MDTGSANATYAGTITDTTANVPSGGPLGLTKLGGNTLTLTASNTYTGLTTISSGTLQLGGSAAKARKAASSSGTIADNAALSIICTAIRHTPASSAAAAG